MRLLCILGAAAACALAAPVTASAEGGFAPGGPFLMGLEVRAVDAGAGKVKGVMHCVDPSNAGREAVFTAGPGVDLSTVSPGTIIGVVVERSGVISELKPAPCDVRPAGEPAAPPQGAFEPRPPAPKQLPPAGGRPENKGPVSTGAPDLPAFTGGFLNRVWKFAATADGFENGKLSVTIEKLLNLPRRFRKDDDELLDQDAIVLVGSGVKILDRQGKRLPASALADADEVRVQGKLLPPRKWQTDEDDEPVATIRAKRVYVLG